jgi:hypothetical protein
VSVTTTESHRTAESDEEDSFLRKQAMDYFNTHAAQRLTIFNFYIGLSSVTATGYFASFKSDSDLQWARALLAFLLCFFAFVFWKLDQRTKAMIKNAEDALKYFEKPQAHPVHAKVFLHEEMKTDARSKAVQGWRVIMFWRWQMSYSDCFHVVYSMFFVIGLGALLWNHVGWMQWCWHSIRRLL